MSGIVSVEVRSSAAALSTRRLMMNWYGVAPQLALNPAISRVTLTPSIAATEARDRF